MTEIQLFPPGTVPEHATPEWYAGRDRAPHLEQPLHRPRLELAAEVTLALVDELGLDLVIDAGAGDGGLLALLADELAERPGVDGYGYDLQPSNVAGADYRGVDVRLGNVLELVPLDLIPPGRRAVVVATEMLEHLVDPHGFLVNVALAGAAAVVASSPWTETAGGAYEFHLWAWDEAGYRELLEQTGWTVARQDRAGMFTVIGAVA